MRKNPSKKNPPAAVFVDPGDPGDPDEKPAVPPEQAAFQSEGFQWRGQALAPFAIDRESAWLLHRFCLGAPDLTEISVGAGAFLPDALRMIWFCSHEPEAWLCLPLGKWVEYQDKNRTWKKFTTQERAVELEKIIAAWGNVNVTAKEIPVIVDLAYEIYISARKNQASIVGAEGARPSGN